MKKSEIVDGTKRFAWNSSKESWVVHQKWNSRLFILKPNLGDCCYIINYYSIIFNYHPIIQSSYLIIIQVLFNYNSIIFKGELSGSSEVKIQIVHSQSRRLLLYYQLLFNFIQFSFNHSIIIFNYYSSIIIIQLYSKESWDPDGGSQLTS